MFYILMSNIYFSNTNLSMPMFQVVSSGFAINDKFDLKCQNSLRFVLLFWLHRLGSVFSVYEQRSLSTDTLWLDLTLMFWQSLRQTAVAAAERRERAAATFISMHSCLMHSKFMMVQLSAVARCVTMATTASETKENLVFTISEFTELFTSLPAENRQINAEKWYSIGFKVWSFLGQWTTLNICIM